MSSSYDSVLIYTSLECVVLAFCTHWQLEEGEGSALRWEPGATFHSESAFVAAKPSSAAWSSGWAPPEGLERLSTAQKISKKHTLTHCATEETPLTGFSIIDKCRYNYRYGFACISINSLSDYRSIIESLLALTVILYFRLSFVYKDVFNHDWLNGEINNDWMKY